MNAERVLLAVESLFPLPAWGSFREMRDATGFDNRSIDLFAMSLYPSSGHKIYAVEVKVSRSDFLRELKNPAKSRPWVELSNRFAFAVPRGLIQVDELPEWASLIEVGEDDYSAKWTRVRERQRKGKAPPLSFLASVVRRQAREEFRVETYSCWLAHENNREPVEAYSAQDAATSFVRIRGIKLTAGVPVSVWVKVACLNEPIEFVCTADTLYGEGGA